MKPILVVAPRALLASVPNVFRELLDRGAELVFAAKTERVDRVKLPDGVLDHPGVSVLPLPLRRKGPDAAVVKLARLTADYARFRDGADWRRRRIGRRLAALSVDGEALDASPDALREAERLIEPEPALERAIGELRVGGILLVTRCSFGGFEPDVIKVARKLGIPSVMLVWSWDNLSSKAVLHEHPDHLLVWNEVQRTEAAELHGFPAERVSVVGAANFDRFFDEVAAVAPRADPSPSILYLGSSENVAPNEPAILDGWLAALRTSTDARVVVRPHPGQQLAWRGWSPPEGVTLLPAVGKAEPGLLARLLADADVVVALNTSAEIEAAIAGRPVVTFRAGADAPGQEGSLHFEYLLEGKGGFVVDTPSAEASVERVAAGLRGELDTGRIRDFVERFVRPQGLDRPVSPIVASTVLELVG